MDLSWGDYIKLGFGSMAWLNKHRALVDDVIALRKKHAVAIEEAIALWESVSPPDTSTPKILPAPITGSAGMSHTEVIEKIVTGNMSPAEKAIMDRASQSFG